MQKSVLEETKQSSLNRPRHKGCNLEISKPLENQEAKNSPRNSGGRRGSHVLIEEQMDRLIKNPEKHALCFCILDTQILISL